MRATNAEGTGAWSATIGVGTTVLPNEAPTFSSAATLSMAENETTVGTVTATDADPSDSITGYAISGGADQGKFSIDTNGALTFQSAPNYEDPTDTDTDNAYAVEVTATSGTSGRELTATQAITVTVTDVAEPPSAPAEPVISAETATGFTVTWTEPANTGPAITGYAVQYSEGTSGSWTDAGHSSTALTLTLAGLTPGTSYQVQVQATNAEGASPWSATATGTTEAAPPLPAQPTALTVTGGHQRAALSWTAPSGAVTKYQVRRSTDGGTSWSPDWTDTGTDPATATSVTVTGLTNGTAYTFAVRAVNVAGAGAASASVTVTPANVVPGRPAKPTVEAVGDGGILIRWQAPRNRGSAFTQLVLEQRLAAGSAWLPVFRHATLREYLNRGAQVVVGTAYEYRVTAYNAAGPGTPSEASDPVTAVAAAVTVSESALSVPEGSSAPYSIALTVKPAGRVTVTAALSGDSDLSVSPTSLTFTTDDWSTAQTVTVSAAHDVDDEDGTATITHTASGGSYASVSIASVAATEDDDEANAAPTFSSANTFSVAENETTVGTVVATDADASDSISGYAISGGADQGKFSIDTNGALTFKSAPNYEAPTDAGTDNTYAVEVTATGGTSTRALTATQTITVTVTDVAEPPSAPATPTISAVTETGFTVSWTAPANTGSGDHRLRGAVPGLGRHVGRRGAQRHGSERGGDGADGQHRLRGAGEGDERRGHECLVGHGHGDDHGGGERGADVQQCQHLQRGGE